MELVNDGGARLRVFGLEVAGAEVRLEVTGAGGAEQGDFLWIGDDFLALDALVFTGNGVLGHGGGKGMVVGLVLRAPVQGGGVPEALLVAARVCAGPLSTDTGRVLLV